MIVHNYDALTGEYTGPSEARIDPVDKTPMLPGSATFIDPPVTTAGFAPVFADGAWSVVMDKRGLDYWIGPDQFKISDLGEDVPPGASLTAPPYVPTEGDVDMERDRRIALGFNFQGVIYQARPQDLANIGGTATASLGAITILGAQPGDMRWADADKDFTWIAADNSLIPMDAHTAYAFALAAMAHKSKFMFIARVLKNSPISATYADDANWPPLPA